MLMDPRTEGQGVAGSQGYEERHLGVLDRGGLILTTAGTNGGGEASSTPPGPLCTPLSVAAGGERWLPWPESCF